MDMMAYDPPASKPEMEVHAEKALPALLCSNPALLNLTIER
jgi:hypothetical protein